MNTAAAMGAKVISNSYGGNEFSSESTLASAYDHPGVAITVSSGDSGYGAQAPAAFNTVTAVGGTHLSLNGNGTRNTETVWSGAGSGCSAYIAKPTWQPTGSCGTKRTIADVSAVADPATGVAVYDSYGSTGGHNWYVFGGTSVAAPIIGGVYALSGNTDGDYPASLAYAAPTGTLFDVVGGSNGRCSRAGTPRVPTSAPVSRATTARAASAPRRAPPASSSSTSGTGPEPRAGPVVRPAGCAGLGWPPRLAGSHPVRLVRA